MTRHSDMIRPERVLDDPNSTAFLKHSGRFLKAPLLGILRYHLTKAVSRLPILPKKNRRKLAKSLEKRDFRALAHVLEDYTKNAHPFEATGTLPASFLDTQPSKRGGVLLSDWHRRYIKSRNTLPVDLPEVAVSFVTYNSERWLPGFFQTLQALEYPLEKVTLLFTDHGSQDGTLAALRDFSARQKDRFKAITVFERDNLGFGAGHHHNIMASDADYVLVSNVDVEFAPDTLSRVMASAVVDDADIASWEVRQCPYEHPKYYDPVTLETSWSSHACILIRKDAYVQVGGYEEKIFMYGEDVELSYRFRANGYRLRYLPHVVVRHFVDFDNPEIRPHQLSGSLSANVLLRYRYGGNAAGQHGEALLNAAHKRASSRNAKAFQDAVETVVRDKAHYQTVHTPSHKGIFPFNGFDYELTRLGHDWKVDSLTPPPEQPMVSIITRTHGPHPKILREAMASVLNQTYPHIEHIIVEDRTDFAQEMVEETAHSYGADIRYIRSERGGRSPAANTGLEAAKGDLLLFLDNDDLLFPDHVEVLVRGLQNNPDAVAAYSMSWEVPTYFTAGGSYREGHFTVPAPFLQPYSGERFEKGNFLPIQAVLFRKQLFLDEGGIDESIDHLEDWNLWARYARRGSFAKIDKLTSFYRIPGDPVFQAQRQAIMLEAEETVRLKTFGQ